MTPLGFVAARYGKPLALVRNQARDMFGLLTTQPAPDRRMILICVATTDGNQMEVVVGVEQARALGEQLLAQTLQVP